MSPNACCDSLTRRCLDEAVKGLVGQGVKLQHYGPAMQALTTYIKEATGQRFSPLQVGWLSRD